MRALILGGDGYLGWPTAMAFRRAGHEVCAVDNYLRRTIARDTNSDALMANPLLPERAALFEKCAGQGIEVAIGDCCDFAFLSRLVEKFAPDVLVHYAEQPSAPYSMMGYDQARTTLSNNLVATFNTIWAVMRHAADCHIVKLGTMGEYGTPNIDIEEGWIEIAHKGRSDKFLFPRQAGSLYHTTKVLDTDLLWFYVRVHGLRVTDLMQGPVYGLSTDEADLDPRLKPNFHYDDITCWHRREPFPGAGGGFNSADGLRPRRAETRLSEPARHAAMRRACGGTSADQGRVEDPQSVHRDFFGQRTCRAGAARGEVARP